MLTSLFAGVSGLNANMANLSVIGNNIANVNTIGFKASRASFADIMSQTLSGASGSNQVGLGVKLVSVTPLFTQGAFETTSNGMDMAIDGNGFFMVRDSSGAVFYSRAGAFNIDRNGFITNPDGYILRGYPADTAGNISSTIGDVQLSSASVPPRATASIDKVANLNSASEIKGYKFTTGTNDNIVFNVGGGNINASLTTNGGLISGTVYTGTQVASAIKTALEAQDGNSNVYTVTYDNSTGKFTVTNNTGNATALNILWTNVGTTSATVNSPFSPMIGFTADSSLAAGSSATSANAGGNFDVANASTTSNFSTTMTVYDSLGNPHQVTTYFRKSSTAASGNTWQWYAVVPKADSANSPTTDEIQARGTLTFDTNGALNSASTITYPTGGFDFAGGASLNQAIAFNFGTSILSGGTGTNGVTQYGSNSSITDQRQDGYASGSLLGSSIDSNGIITGIFSNGRTRSLGQIALASFRTPSALTLMGKNLYAESSDSGQPLVGAPGNSGRGSINSSALELSTVDIAEEFVKMISAQRGFQANSKVITTTDEMLSELVNLKR